MTRPCQVGRCRHWNATRCGTVYACPDCRAQIERMTAQHLAASAGGGQ
jgi:hypothetical protein